jgi:hypothetical protein
MKKLLYGIVFVVLTGCEFPQEEHQQQMQQLEEEIIVIARKDNITIYKVRDRTIGGEAWIYFSSTGDIK